MELQKAQDLATLLMARHSLFTEGWQFKFDNAKRRFGVCKHGRKVIGLSKPIVLLNDVLEVRDVILHEIAHALVGSGHGHDNVWKAKVKEIGAKPERCYDDSKVETPDAKYIAICRSCSTVHKRHKKPNSRFQSCGRCNPKFDRRYLLVWKNNH